MSKEIIDYLHLYFGCLVQVKMIKRIVGYEEGRYALNGDLLHCFNLGYLEVKPFLRKLSSISKKERKELAAIIGLDCDPEVHIWTPDQFVWLLYNGFDLFGLIESGLAIDKSKINSGGEKVK